MGEFSQCIWLTFVETWLKLVYSISHRSTPAVMSGRHMVDSVIVLCMYVCPHFQFWLSCGQRPRSLPPPPPPWGRFADAESRSEVGAEFRPVLRSGFRLRAQNGPKLTGEPQTDVLSLGCTCQKLASAVLRLTPGFRLCAQKGTKLTWNHNGFASCWYPPRTGTGFNNCTPDGSKSELMNF